MPRTSEHIPAAPFVRWVNEQIAMYGDRALANDTCLSSKSVYRYKTSVDGEGQPTDSYPVDQVENVLNLAGYYLWDLYPDLAGEDSEIVEGWCSVCEEVVGIDKEQRCLWCSTPTSHPMSRAERAIRAGTVCPQCGGRKSPGGAYRCRSCYGQPTPPDNRVKTKLPCPICGGPKPNASAMRCAKCYRGLHLDTGKRKPMGHHLKKITEPQLLESWELYNEHGFSVREVVEMLDHSYTTTHAAEHAVIMAWRARGFKTRGQGETRKIVEERRRYVGRLPVGNRSGKMVRAKAR